MRAPLGLTYYYDPQAASSASSCALYGGFISSVDGGSRWNTAAPVAGPMALSWPASINSGQMVGDSVGTSFAGGKAYGFFAVARARSGVAFDGAIYTTQAGFDVAAVQGRNRSAGERPLRNEPDRLSANRQKAPLTH